MECGGARGKMMAAVRLRLPVVSARVTVTGMSPHNVALVWCAVVAALGVTATPAVM